MAGVKPTHPHSRAMKGCSIANQMYDNDDSDQVLAIDRLAVRFFTLLSDQLGLTQ